MKITKSQLKQIIKEEMEAVQEIDWTRTEPSKFKPGQEHEDAGRYVETCFRNEEVNSVDFGQDPEGWVTAFNKCMDKSIAQLKIKQDPATWLGEADNTPELKDA